MHDLKQFPSLHLPNFTRPFLQSPPILISQHTLSLIAFQPHMCFEFSCRHCDWLPHSSDLLLGGFIVVQIVL